MKPADNINNFFKNAAVNTNPKMDEAVLDKALAAYEKAKVLKPALAEVVPWRTIMRSPLTKLAIAASVIVACLIGMLLWRGTQSGIALADVLTRVEQIKAFSLTWSMKITIEDPNDPYHYEGRGTELISQGYSSKLIFEETDANGAQSPFQELYFVPQKNVRIGIAPRQKKYMRVELNNMYVEQEKKRGGLLLQNNPLYYLKNMLKHNYESLGRSTIDGIEVTAFQYKDPNFPPGVKKRLWVDLKTLLPVRYEYEHVKQTADKTQDHMHMVVSDFQWDLSIDAAEFMPGPIPDDYTIQDSFPDVAREETAVQGLKQCIELLGNYPESVDLTYLWSEFEKSETSAALQLKEELKGLTGLDRDNKKMDALKPMRFLSKFYRGLNSQNPAYYGQTVTPKDPDKVLLRWTLEDGHYRVIFGDLHGETVTPEELAQLEKPK